MLKLVNISVDFPDFSLKNISLDISDEEYHVLLGPSGSGKTLLLNCIAGFQKIKAGEIYYSNKNITNIPANKRNISFLFQDLALFPHMDVKSNLEYPLKIKGVSKSEREKLINEYLDFVEIKHLKDRRTDNLSGGEKQRVAIARCLITGNKLILLDEPFSAIDSQLILSLKKLLKKISSKGISIIHVTHNFEEAINMAQKISVIENGRIMQTGKIDEIFNNPGSCFVANFRGKKNYFTVNQVINNDTGQYILINSIDSKSGVIVSEMENNYWSTKLDSLAEGKYVIIQSGESQEILPGQGVIIETKDIIISESKIISSARNNFLGFVSNIFPTQDAYEIEIYCGINIWVEITKQSFKEMNIREGKKIYLSFKASSVKITV
jgi:molybdate/tungstate transport system ATP-binding protein